MDLSLETDGMNPGFESLMNKKSNGEGAVSGPKVTIDDLHTLNNIIYCRDPTLLEDVTLNMRNLIQHENYMDLKSFIKAGQLSSVEESSAGAERKRSGNDAQMLNQENPLTY